MWSVSSAQKKQREHLSLVEYSWEAIVQQWRKNRNMKGTKKNPWDIKSILPCLFFLQQKSLHIEMSTFFSASNEQFRCQTTLIALVLAPGSSMYHEYRIKDSEYVPWYMFKICARGYVYMIKFTKSTNHIKAGKVSSTLDLERSWGIKNKGRRFLVQSRGAGVLDKYFGKEGVQKAMWWWQEVDSWRETHNEEKQEILMRKNIGLTAPR